MSDQPPVEGFNHFHTLELDPNRQHECAIAWDTIVDLWQEYVGESQHAGEKISVADFGLWVANYHKVDET